MNQRLALSAVICVLAGCATLPDSPANTSNWTENRERLQARTSWDVAGRVAIATAQDGVNGTLDWRQRDTAMDIRFRGPLGIGGFRIQGSPADLTVTTRDGEQVRLDSGSDELARLVGWPVPVDSARFWVMGVPDPGREASETLGQSGYLEALEQRGWQVRYSSYRNFGDLWLPRKIVMTGGDVRIRLVLDRRE